jgi:hypothetical protein
MVEEEVRQASAQLPPAMAFKLGRMVSWEVLLGSVVQFLAEWPTQLPGAPPPPGVAQGLLSLHYLPSHVLIANYSIQ